MDEMMDALNLNKKSGDEKEKEKSEQLKTRSEGEWSDGWCLHKNAERVNLKGLRPPIGEPYWSVSRFDDEPSDKWITI